jgi:hypothetical protein
MHALTPCQRMLFYGATNEPHLSSRDDDALAGLAQ